MTKTTEVELIDACAHVEAHYGHPAIVDDPVAFEVLYQARRLDRVRNLGMVPARELALALAEASAGIAERAKTSAPWRRFWVAAERTAADLLGVTPTKQDAPKTSYGYDGTACSDCGQFTVRIVGTCRGCTSCGWSGGCG